MKIDLGRYLIFVMEYKHKDRLKADYARLLQYKKIVVLDIADDYGYMDTELVEVLRGTVEGYLT